MVTVMTMMMVMVMMMTMMTVMVMMMVMMMTSARWVCSTPSVTSARCTRAVCTFGLWRSYSKPLFLLGDHDDDLFQVQDAMVMMMSA